MLRPRGRARRWRAGRGSARGGGSSAPLPRAPDGLRRASSPPASPARRPGQPTASPALGHSPAEGGASGRRAGPAQRRRAAAALARGLHGGGGGAGAAEHRRPLRLASLRPARDVSAAPCPAPRPLARRGARRHSIGDCLALNPPMAAALEVAMVTDAVRRWSGRRRRSPARGSRCSGARSKAAPRRPAGSHRPAGLLGAAACPSQPRG